MKNIVLLIILMSFFLPSIANAVVELGVDYGYDRSVYGIDRENTSRTRSYSGMFAWYLFGATAIEVNYSYSKDVDDKIIGDSSQGITLDSSRNIVETKVKGIGLRQALSSKRARIRPVFSAGYARQVVEYSKKYLLSVDATGEQGIIEQGPIVGQYDSVFATFSMQFRVTKTVYLKGSVKTLFPAFEFAKAKDDLSYTAGLSWFF